MEDEKVMKIARVCHEVNRAYCEAIGDKSQVEWSKAATNIQQSAIAGVRFKLHYPMATAADQHESWRKFKADDGWLFGEVKSSVHKTHPCMIPYEKLPVEQQVKDHLFAAVVENLK